MIYYVFFVQKRFKFVYTVLADALAFVLNAVSEVIAENTGRLILF